MTPECSHCLSEPIARELALKLGLNEYVAIHQGVHWRRTGDGDPIDKALYVIPYWHALVRASQRELKLIESRAGL